MARSRKARSRKSHSRKSRSRKSRSRKSRSRKSRSRKAHSRKSRSRKARKSSKSRSRSRSPSHSMKGVKAYCVRCRHKTHMMDAHLKTFRNGRKALAGKCEKCGTKMFRFVKA